MPCVERRCSTSRKGRSAVPFSAAMRFGCASRPASSTVPPTVAEELTSDARRHGFDYWVVMGAAQQATVDALSALSAGEIDPKELQTHIGTLTFIVQSWREAEATLFVSFYDAVLAQLLAAAGKPDEARERLDIALQLGEETGVNFYRAELLRLRAHTTEDTDERDADLRAAIDTARQQNASIFELRAVIDDFELRGASSQGRVGRRDQQIPRRQRLAGTGSSADTTRVSRPGGKVAILGGGMAGLSAAWRLSEPGWRDRFDSITVYQRGWRLGGKGASSRGPHGRIEEHGLHIWLGYYENAFGMLRECYAEIDRATTDPTAPIKTWDQALIPGDNLGLADRFGSDWLMWLGTFTRNDGVPGEPDATGREMTVLEFTRRAVRLVLDFAESQRSASPIGLELSTSADPTPVSGWVDAVQSAAMARFARAHRSSRREAHVERGDRQCGQRHARGPRLRTAPRPPAVVAAAVDDDRGDPRDPRRQPGHRSARFPGDQRRGLQRMAFAPRRTSGRLGLRVGARPVRLGLRLRGRRPAATVIRCGASDLPDRFGVVPVQGRDLLEDDRRHGRHRHRPDVPGAAEAWCRVRILSPSRRVASR